MLKRLFCSLIGQKQILFILIFCVGINFCSLFISSNTSASTTSTNASTTVTAKRISDTRRMIPLRKLTIGPDDQYDATVSPDGNLMIYTHKSDLISHLRIQKINTGEYDDLLPLTGDSQEPAFAPDGRLVFNYFKNNARGDICFLNLEKNVSMPVKNEEIHCLKRAVNETSVQRSTPFWSGPDEIGYLERNIEGQSTRVIFENIKSGTRKVIKEGKIWAPNMRSGGRYLAFNDLIYDSVSKSHRRHLVVRDLAVGKDYPVSLQIPGISGFPEISPDEKHLYFSHFVNDTNDDKSIDGSDNAVVYRLTIDSLVQKTKQTGGDDPVLPEQLTSVENSCSFPSLHNEKLYVTCGYEGSLDVYEMPQTGVVPANWNLENIKNAVASVRSYQDRVLLLNTLRYRTMAQNGVNDRAMEEEMLSEHILSGDLPAAKFYAIQILKKLNKKDRDNFDFFKLLKIYLEAREVKSTLPSRELSQVLQKKLKVFENEILIIKNTSSFKFIVQSWIKVFLGDLKAAEKLFKLAQAQAEMHPIERFLRLDLAEVVFSESLPKSMIDLLSVYQQSMSAKENGRQAQIYYGFRFLKRIQQILNSRIERISKIELLNKNLPQSVSQLLGSEILTLRLIEAESDKGKFAIYSDLDKLMIAIKDDYFLKRALFVRSITNFADANDFKFMGFIADNWMRYTKMEDTEFAYAREAFSLIALDRAYGNLDKGPNQLAASYFYQSLSLTDDLESHYGYITTLNGFGQRKVIEDRYKSLQDQKLVDDNMKFVHAILTLIDEKPKADGDSKYVKHLDLAIEKLNSMVQDRDAAIRYLVLGYCYLEKMLRLANGAEFDALNFQNAHKNLMLAYDLGRDNERLRASALINLGILHERVQNHGLAARFFKLRKKLGFLNEEEKTAFSWLFAKSLSASYQSELAVEELSTIVSMRSDVPIHERYAFYLMESGKYERAAEEYKKLINLGKIKDAKNLAIVNLSYGFSSFKAKLENQAQIALKESVRQLGIMKRESKSVHEVLEFEPKRGLLVAYGLLSQIGNESEREKYLNLKYLVLEDSKKIVDDWLASLIQNRMQLAALKMKSVDQSVAAKAIKVALLNTEKLADENGYLGHTVFRSSLNILVYYLTQGDFLKKQSDYLGDIKRVKKLAQNVMTTIEQQKEISTVLTMQKLKLKICLVALESRSQGLSGLSIQIKDILKSPEAGSLEKNSPDTWMEIKTLASQVQQINFN